MMRYVLVVICTVAVLCMQGCSQSGDSSKSKRSSQTTKVAKAKPKPKKNEPPFNMGRGNPGDMVRSTELVNFENSQIVYKVEYLALGLTSVATLGFPMKETIKEVFEGRWTVIYLYDDMMHKASHLPTGIEIYKYASGGDNRGQLINSYSFDSITQPGKAKYVDKRGKSRTIDVGCFSFYLPPHPPYL